MKRIKVMVKFKKWLEGKAEKQASVCLSLLSSSSLLTSLEPGHCEAVCCKPQADKDSVEKCLRDC